MHNGIMGGARDEQTVLYGSNHPPGPNGNPYPFQELALLYNILDRNDIPTVVVGPV